MSINLLEHLGFPVTVADELEAFLHVLLYNAVRFLIHNCDLVVPFVKGYFDCQDQASGKLFPPRLKRDCIRLYGGPQHCGENLVFRRPSGARHAINSIFQDLFRLIQGRYAVLDYNTKKFKLEKEIEEEVELEKEKEAARPAQQGSPQHRGLIRVRKVEAQATPVPVDSVARKGSAQLKFLLAQLREPTEDEHARSVACHDHERFIALLTKSSNENDWDEDDKIAYDRLEYQVQDSVMLHSKDLIERPAKMLRLDHGIPHSSNVGTA